MNNNLIQAKKDLKAFAKRAKNVKYTESLLFSYLVTGLITFSIGINTSSSVLYERMNKELIMSAEQTRNIIKKKKKENVFFFLFERHGRAFPESKTVPLAEARPCLSWKKKHIFSRNIF